MVATASEAVLMLHGLWMNRLVMQPLKMALDKAGFQPVVLPYRSMRGRLEEHCERVADCIASLSAPRIHLLGHSMGGVIALNFIVRHPSLPRLGRTLLLGAPIASCHAARDFARHGAGRLLMGQSVDLWENAAPLRIPTGKEVGVIAGTQRLGLGRFLVTLAGANDGVVGVEETRLQGIADHLVLPVSHTGMLFSPAVARQCITFLQQGKFSQ